MKSTWKISPTLSIGLSEAIQSIFWLEGGPRGARIPSVHSEAVKLGELGIKADKLSSEITKRKNSDTFLCLIAKDFKAQRYHGLSHIHSR